MTSVRLVRFVALGLAVAGLAACGGGGKDKERLPGERISVLAFESKVEADPRIQSVAVKLPRPYLNTGWPQPGGFPSHAMHHLALEGQLQPLWTSGVGAGEWDFGKLVTSPIVVGQVVYSLDAEGLLSAFDLDTGRAYWRRNLSPHGEDKDENIGGGVTYNGGRLFVATGLGRVYGVHPQTGQVLWERNFKLPFRSAPTAVDGRLFVITHDNQLFALDVATGKTLWEHQVIVEGAGLLGNSSPAVEGDVLIAPFTSGELVALRVENGRVAWQDILTRTGRLTSLSTLSDIAGRPVIDRGRVFAVSHSGRMVSIDLRTGERVWTRNLASTQTPWVAGDFIYVVTTEGEVVCLSRDDGRVRWVHQLERWEDPERQEGVIVWSGPVLASNRLIMVSSDGRITALSPYSGKVLGQILRDHGSYISPIVANGRMLVLDTEGNLTAYQ